MTTDIESQNAELEKKQKQLALLIEELLFALESLWVIVIELEEGDDPQEVFETLNSKGVPLRESDKIRNSILMGLDRNDIAYGLWRNIERETTNHIFPQKDSERNKLEEFFRDYLSWKNEKNIPEYRIYEYFKKELEKRLKNKESDKTDQMVRMDFLNELRRVAKIYAKFLTIDIHDKKSKLQQVQRRLNLMGRTVINPFLLALYDAYNNKKLAEEELTKILEKLETYLFYRFVCSKPTNELSRLFPSLYSMLDGRRINRFSLLAVFDYYLRNEAPEFPESDVFLQVFGDRNFYDVQAMKLYIFDRLCNTESKEITDDIVKKLKSTDYSIEHVMPQHLTDKWEIELLLNYERKGKETAKDLHKQWLHRIANLTITGKNAEMSNYTFQEKKQTYENSTIAFTKKIAAKEHWNVAALEARTEELRKNAEGYWPANPINEYVPPETGSIYELHQMPKKGKNHGNRKYLITRGNEVPDEKQFKVLNKWDDFIKEIMMYFSDQLDGDDAFYKDIEETAGDIRITSNIWGRIDHLIEFYADCDRTKYKAWILLGKDKKEDSEGKKAQADASQASESSSEASTSAVVPEANSSVESATSVGGAEPAPSEEASVAVSVPQTNE